MLVRGIVIVVLMEVHVVSNKKDKQHNHLTDEQFNNYINEVLENDKHYHQLIKDLLNERIIKNAEILKKYYVPFYGNLEYFSAHFLWKIYWEFYQMPIKDNPLLDYHKKARPTSES